MTNYLTIKVVNRTTGKVLLERLFTGVPFEDVPFFTIVESLVLLYRSFEHSIIFIAQQFPQLRQMDDVQFHYLKGIIYNYNHLFSSPFPIIIRGLRDDDGLHAKVQVSRSNIRGFRFCDFLLFGYRGCRIERNESFCTYYVS